MNSVWNVNELEKITCFLNRNNFKLDENNNVCKIRDMDSHEFVFASHNLTSYRDEFNSLFHIQDKKQIYNMLKKTISIRYTVRSNKNNPMCNGLLTTLANIDPGDATEVFTILKELLVQYIRVSYNLAEHIADKLKEPELIKEKIEEIKNSSTETKEELYIRNYMNKLLSYTNGVFDNGIFTPIINKCNNNIKNKLLIHLEKKVNLISRYKDDMNYGNCTDYRYNTLRKIYKKANAREVG